MLHPSIRLEGSILSADILDSIERGERSHQSAKDFGLESGTKVKDEIADAWAAARAYWAAYQVKIGRLKEGASGTTETRNLFIGPLLELLSYHPALAESETLDGKIYRISHRDATRDSLPIHVIGWHESLDRRSTIPNAPRMSPHGLLQEYLNLTEHLYGILTNGRIIRLLRDSSRLVKLSFIEFDLERIFSEELFSEFALLYRLVHSSRLPVRQDAAGESPIEIYHQDSLDSGSRIRDGLSKAVHTVILNLGNGFLTNPANERLRALAANDPHGKFATDFYSHLLRLIYRLLFLMVIEERGLAHIPGTDKRLREIYDLGYSLARLRRLSEKPHFADARHHDAWLALVALFRLVDESGRGLKLGVAPLGGDLFNSGSLGLLEDCSLDNATFLTALRQLTLFTNPVTRQLMRVNYGALNVEEFGSVYQGLLEFEPRVTLLEENWHFAFAQGDERSATGSHYTEDILVQPLLKHSLDHLIADALSKSSSSLHPSSLNIHPSEAALLSLRVADISCGSGHILLAAARRIGLALAIVRTGDDQPSPAALREATRDAIKNCIYGVDLNPLAVELCKVALWLEAHSPGEPLNFLDHHIKCGNAIVGFVTQDELEKGVPDEAFKTLPGDDKDIAAHFRKVNKAERKDHATGQKKLKLAPAFQQKIDAVLARWREISALPEHTPAEIAAKKKRFDAADSKDAYLLRQIAAIPIAQFYQPKTAGNKACLITDAGFRAYLAGQTPQGQATASAWHIAERKRAFHWFLEFPEIIARGGFDCILGNPPYLGGQALSGTYGHDFCNYVKCQYAPIGLSDLVVFFLRRIHSLTRTNGFLSIVTTKTIKDKDARKDGLDKILELGGEIVFATSSIRWPGVANLHVSIFSIKNGTWQSDRVLDGNVVRHINSFFESTASSDPVKNLSANKKIGFNGSNIFGDGFYISDDEFKDLRKKQKYEEVTFPVINGKELTSIPDQEPLRKIISFFEKSLEESKKYPEALFLIEERVKPERDLIPTDTSINTHYHDHWWQYGVIGSELYRQLRRLDWCLAIAAPAKYLAFSKMPTNVVFTHAVRVFPRNRWDFFAVIQSSIHEFWARKYNGDLGPTMRYSPTACFTNYPLPAAVEYTGYLDPADIEENLAAIGERYHEHRRELMLRLWLGLTDIYNLFHAPDLDARLAKLFTKREKSPDWQAAASVPPEHRATAGTLTPDQARDAIHHLRTLHRELDQAVLTAYGWQESSEAGPAIHLSHDFQQVETLPENDRTRYTITPASRKELLTRLLKLNHQRAAEEAAAAPPVKRAKTKKPQRAKKEDELL